MRKTITYLLLAAGILSLAGCQKNGLSGTVSGDNTIRFGASATPGTKAAYSGDMTGNFERIAWQTGDLIRIYSDKATHRYLDQKFADYAVTSETADGRNSKAEIAPATEYNGMKNGLVWGDEADTYKFWGVYPSTECANGSTGVFDLEIDASQDKGDAAVNFPKYGFLTATATAEITEEHFDGNRIVKTVKNGGTKEDVTLAFEPAFTAFEIELISNDAAMTVTEFSLSSASKSMAGKYTVTYNGTTRTFADANATPVKAVTLTNLGELAPASADAAGSTLTFTVFAQPQTYNDLTLSLKVNVGDSAQTRSLKLTKNGTGVTFDALMKHRLKGIALPGELWKIFYAPFDVDEWVELGTTNLIVE